LNENLQTKIRKIKMAKLICNVTRDRKFNVLALTRDTHFSKQKIQKNFVGSSGGKIKKQFV